MRVQTASHNTRPILNKQQQNRNNRVKLVMTPLKRFQTRGHRGGRRGRRRRARRNQKTTRRTTRMRLRTTNTIRIINTKDLLNIPNINKLQFTTLQVNRFRVLNNNIKSRILIIIRRIESSFTQNSTRSSAQIGPNKRSVHRRHTKRHTRTARHNRNRNAISIIIDSNLNRMRTRTISNRRIFNSRHTNRRTNSKRNRIRNNQSRQNTRYITTGNHIRHRTLNTNNTCMINIRNIRRMHTLNRIMTRRTQGHRRSNKRSRILRVIGRPGRQIKTLMKIRTNRMRHTTTRSIIRISNRRRRRRTRSNNQSRRRRHYNNIRRTILPLMLTSNHMRTSTRTRRSKRRNNRHRRLRQDKSAKNSNQHRQQLIQTRTPIPLNRSTLRPTRVTSSSQHLIISINRVRQPIGQHSQQVQVTQRMIQAQVRRYTNRRVHRQCYRRRRSRMIRGTLSSMLRRPAASRVAKGIVPPTRGRGLDSVCKV